MTTEDKAWHLDKRVNVSIITALLFQAALFVWYASALWGRVDTINDRVRVLEEAEQGRPQRRDAIQQQLSDLKSQMATLNERSKSTGESIGEVKRAVETLTQKLLDAASKK